MSRLFIEVSGSYTILLMALSTCQLVPSSMSSHVLLVPFPYRSHVTEINSIGKGLLERGHRVTIMLSASYPDLEKVRTESGFRVVDYAVTEPDFYSRDYSGSLAEWVATSIQLDPMEDMRTNVEGFMEFCTNALDDPTLPDRLVNSTFGRPDLAVVDAFPYYRCLWIICVQLGVPYVSLTTQYEPWLMRVPALPSFVPFPFAAGGRLTEKMTFWQRVENARSLVDWVMRPRHLKVIEDRFVKRYLPDETYTTLAARTMIWLFDTDIVVDYARPTMPNEINVGGLSTKPARSLQPGPLADFAQQSDKRMVVVSFGSIDFVGSLFFDQFFNAFRQVSELNFVWRYDGEIPTEHSDETTWPRNILTQKWLPQNDLLGHDNTVLFIGHCGANSQYEAIYHGVPMICLTLWADQMYNADRMQYRGYGMHVDRMVRVQTERLVDAIRQVAFNLTYSDNVRRASAIFKSRPMNSRQTAVWWIEHVIRYGASHVHSHAADMIWYEYLMLDVIGIFVLLPVVVIASGSTALVCWVWGRRTSRDNDCSASRKRIVDKKIK